MLVTRQEAGCALLPEVGRACLRAKFDAQNERRRAEFSTRSGAETQRQLKRSAAPILIPQTKSAFLREFDVRDVSFS